MIKKLIGSLCLAGGMALSVHGDTIIEPFGMLSENFIGGKSWGFHEGKAVGLSDVRGVKGSDDRAGQLGHFYTYSFTPGITPDNFQPAAGTDYGNGTEFANGLTQSGLPDRGTGLYQVFATWYKALDGDSNQVITGGLTNYTINGENGSEISVSVNQNDTIGSPGNDRWLLLGTVELKAGETYILTQTPTSPAEGYDGSSMKSSGVMFAPIPEPSTYAVIFGGLALVGAFVYRRRIGAKK